MRCPKYVLQLTVHRPFNKTSDPEAWADLFLSATLALPAAALVRYQGSWWGRATTHCRCKEKNSGRKLEGGNNPKKDHINDSTALGGSCITAHAQDKRT